MGCLNRGNQWVHSEEIPVRDCVKAKHVRWHITGAVELLGNFYVLLGILQNITGLSVNFTVFMSNWSICHKLISDSFGKIFKKRAQFNSVKKLCFKVTPNLHRLPSCSFTRGENWTNLLFSREHRYVWINFSVNKLIVCLSLCLNSRNSFNTRSWLD